MASNYKKVDALVSALTMLLYPMNWVCYSEVGSLMAVAQPAHSGSTSAAAAVSISAIE